MLPNYVSVVTRARAAHLDAAVIHPGVKVIDEDGNEVHTLVDETKRRLYRPRLPQRTVLGGEDLARSLLRGNWMYFPATVFRTAAAQAAGFREGQVIVLDLDLYLRLLLEGGRLVLVDEVLFRYRRHEHSISSMERLTAGRFLEEAAYFGEMAETMREHGWLRASRAARTHLTSRLHAALLLPAAVRARRRGLARALVRHTIGRTPIPAAGP
jgi:hypothetical protein